jgi:hypothetical protein
LVGDLQGVSVLGALVRFVAARRSLFGLGVARLVSLTRAGERGLVW